MRIIRILIIVLMAGVFVYTLYYLYSKNQEQPVSFETTKPFITDIVRKSVATGSIVPRKEVEIKPQISGVIQEILVQAGDIVKEGDLIARIKVIPNMVNLNNAENRVSQAKIALENAKLDYNRNKDLYEQGVIAIAQFQPFEIAFKNAKTELEAAENNLELVRDGFSKNMVSNANTLIRSTNSGMVLDVPVEQGYTVIEANNFNEGTTIASIANMEDLIFEGQVDESEVGKIKEGMELILTIGALEDVKFKAILEFISPKGVLVEGAIQFEIKAGVVADSSNFIRAGYSANADIVLDKRENVLAINEAFLLFEQGKKFVEVQTKPQIFEKVEVVTGLSDGINIEIISGIDIDTEIKGRKKRANSPAGKGRR